MSDGHSNDSSPESEGGDHDSPLGALKSKLHSHLHDITSAGSFATCGELRKFVAPGIVVPDLGMIRLPLSINDALSLIRMAKQAPFGKGNETLVDVSVRNTWEIEPADIRFTNVAWPGFLKDLAIQAAEELGIDSNTCDIGTEFYKMLLYEKGAMFVPHQDTERSSDMFGTLVVCLASEHSGGAVHLQHANKQVIYESSRSSAFSASFGAWYTDVVHEIKPVESGYRWILVYHLTANKNGKPKPCAGYLKQKTDQFNYILEHKEKLEDSPQVLATILEHSYTVAALALQRLKGNDYPRALHAHQSCQDNGAYIALLGMMEEHWISDDDEDSADPRTRLLLTDIRDMDGFSLLRFEDQYLIIPYQSLLTPTRGIDGEPDRQRGGHYMGNEYASIERWFRESVLLLVPRTELTNFLTGRNPRPINITMILETLHEWRAARGETHHPGDFTYDLYQRYLSVPLTEESAHREVLGAIAGHAARIGDEDIFFQAVDRSTSGFSASSFVEIGSSVDLVEAPGSYKDKIIEAMTKGQHLHQIHANVESFMEGFQQRTDVSVRQRILTRGILDTLLHRSLYDLPNVVVKDAQALVTIVAGLSEQTLASTVLQIGVQNYVDRFQHHREFLMAFMKAMLSSLQEANDRKVGDLVLCQVAQTAVEKFNLYETWDRFMLRFDPEFINGLYSFLAEHSKDQSVQFLIAIQRQALGIESGLLQGLIPLASDILGSSAASGQLFEHTTRQFFEAIVHIYAIGYVQYEPTEPTTLSRPEEKGYECREVCSQCKELNAFLIDPLERSLTMAINKDQLRHIQLHFNDLANLKVTEREDQITVEKTLRGWKKAHAKWESRLTMVIKELEAVPRPLLMACMGDAYDTLLSLDIVKSQPGRECTRD